MARRISTSQLKSKLRQIESKQRQAINNYNRAVRSYNAEVKKRIDAYNRAVRSYNSAVKHNKQIIDREIRKLNSHSSTHVTYRVSLNAMQQHYNVINSIYGEGVEVTSEQNHILDLIEQEHANGLIMASIIESDEMPEENTQDLELGSKLLNISTDLHNRWRGAVFALNPQNPDAARHFCTSARELFTEFIECKAPDNEVFAYNPSCERTDRGNATRREKIKYMMRALDMDDSVAEFADANIQNILELFHVLSDGTHGTAGRYEYEKLVQVKKRVEQGINFLCEIAA